MKKILIVEDEPSASSVLEKKLSDGSLVIFVANNGQQGLELALSNHPDLILQYNLLRPI